MNNSLSIFDPLPRNGLRGLSARPRRCRKAAWPAIAAGEHTLVSAADGDGQALAAFLVYIDRLMTEARQGTLKDELRLIYISPLKSLAGDIRENLRRPWTASQTIYVRPDCCRRKNRAASNPRCGSPSGPATSPRASGGGCSKSRRISSSRRRNRSTCC